MKLSAELLNLLTCPVSGDRLVYDQDRSILISKKAGLAYPIVDNIPLLLESEAIKMNLADSKLEDEIASKEKIEA